MIPWLKFTCNLSFEIHGSENIPNKPCIVFCNHQSAWETLALQIALPQQVWVLKRELLMIPFFGWGLWLTSPIAIDRSSGKKALLQMFNQGLTKIQKGFFIIVFPEGTRANLNEDKKYHIGGSWLAKKIDCPVLPIAHNAGYFWPKNSFLKHPGKITLKIGPLIETHELSTDQINESAKKWINSNVEKIIH
ncbi:MAG: lysophospholipid acyltransferase family protein [Methylophilaceae bacterium]|jgi:1-acyl-sn-glycerol-3-phosphate acyltransferase